VLRTYKSRDIAMGPAEPQNAQLAAALMALLTVLEERNTSLEARVASLESDVAKLSLAIAVLQSTHSLDTMLLNVIIGR
jgi:uncharacterized coiled-coil protein SlyX